MADINQLVVIRERNTCGPRLAKLNLFGEALVSYISFSTADAVAIERVGADDSVVWRTSRENVEGTIFESHETITAEKKRVSHGVGWHHLCPHSKRSKNSTKTFVVKLNAEPIHFERR